VLYYAAFGGSTEIIELLLTKGANFKNKREVNDILRISVYKGHSGVVKLLLEKRPNIDLLDYHGERETVLMEAAHLGYADMVKILLDNGAEPDQQYRGSATSLMLAAENGHVEVVKLLIDHGADVNKKDLYGKTALILAVENNQRDVVKILLSHDADPNVKDDNGDTALDYTYTPENRVPLSMLQEYGAEGRGFSNYLIKDEYANRRKQVYAAMFATSYLSLGIYLQEKTKKLK